MFSSFNECYVNALASIIINLVPVIRLKYVEPREDIMKVLKPFFS